VDFAIDIVLLFVRKLAGGDEPFGALEPVCNWKELVKVRTEKLKKTYR
jgi:hypothetical protein